MKWHLGRVWRISGAILLCACALVPTGVQAQDGAGHSVQAGARLFRAKGCLGCHPIGAVGVGPDLRNVQGDRSFFGLTAAIWNHLPQMRVVMQERAVPVPQLDPWEAGDLVAFLFWLGYFDEPGDTVRGGDLFRAKTCVGCHQVRGVGGVLGPDLDLHSSGSPIMIASAMWNHVPAMLGAHQGQGLRPPQLTGAELRDMVAYIEGGTSRLPRGALVVMPGRRGRGQQVFESKGCV
ncbi:MAG: c-type cytochrome, partial [Synechococcaceae cyanobacterium]|nr:c-type cytochrome [Synechococcaceae cyanobacterium]